MKTLTRDEMKKVMGGRVWWACSCIGSVGSWEYTSEPTTEQRGRDVATYCRSGNGTCAQLSQA